MAIRFLCLVLLLAAGCLEADTVAPASAEDPADASLGTPVPHRTLLATHWCHIRDIAANAVIVNQSGIDRIWEGRNQCQSPTESPPAPAFGTRFVVSVLSNTTNCHGILLNVTDVTHDGRRFHVHYDMAPPQGDACLTAMDKRIQVVEVDRRGPGTPAVVFHERRP